MSDLINDGSLIGLWPLHEPSGTASWKNYSPARGGHPSGISFDLQVHTTNPSTVTQNEAASFWPGEDVFFNVASGVTVRGLKLQGRNRQPGNFSYPYSNVLILGNGNNVIRQETLGPAIANSGFTAGFWVYPNSDGWPTAQADGAFGAADDWIKGYARIHSIMGQFRSDAGWLFGVSGELAGATQFSAGPDGGPHQLRAFVVADQGLGLSPGIDTPLESGRYTHLTMSYRYVDGTNNELVIYKDGRLEASGVTNNDIVFDATPTTGPDSTAFSLGASTDGTSVTDRYKFAGGFGHLVSGAYIFRRVLHEGEVLEMHERGGLQPAFNVRDNTMPVDISDSNLLAYIEQKAPGFVDSSKNRNHLLAVKDPMLEGFGSIKFTWSPGPFGTNRTHNAASTATLPIGVSSSGVAFGLATGAGGFTVCGYMQPSYLSNGRAVNTMFSMGSISTATTGPATALATGPNTRGFHLSYWTDGTLGNRPILEVFPIGDENDGLLKLTPTNEQGYFASSNMHFGVVYDAASNGIALYLDGHETASGTLTHNLQDQLLRIAGSGFPLVFGNGITDQIADSATTKGYLGIGGRDLMGGPYAMFSRPLRADEMRFMAQSGISTSPLWRTRQDPRLMGYWPCDTFDLGDVLTEDKARAMAPLLGHLTRGDTETKWERVYNRDNNQADQDVFRGDATAFVDLFTGETRTPDAFQAAFGNLGITSGIFGPQGNSFMAGNNASNLDSRNTPFNSIARWRPATSERDAQAQNLHEYIISFEVTPSGNIPAIDATAHAAAADQRWFNSYLHVYGNLGIGSVDGDFVSLLTSINAELPGSGITVAFVSRDANSVIVPIISGTIPFGVPSKVLFHARFDTPYNLPEVTDIPMSVSLWIDGTMVSERTRLAVDWRMWTDQTTEGTNADWGLQFGGYANTDALTVNILEDGGLGEIYMREIFLMRGVFDGDEIPALAASGIQNNSIAGYSNQIPTTQISILDDDLQGYWRFNGFAGNTGQMAQSPGGSGTTDLSLKSNHLDAIAQRFLEEDNAGVQMATTTRVVAGPHRNSDIGIQCSGFHNASQAIGATSTNGLPPFAVSGVAFDAPDAGFSVGFLMSRRGPTFVSHFDTVLCYGTHSANGTIIDTTLDPNRGWVIGSDPAGNMKMIVSTGGNMYVSNLNNAAHSGQLVCGAYNAANTRQDLRKWNKWEGGDHSIPGIDYWNHWCWTYDAADKGLRCFLNGTLVDERFIPVDVISPWTGLEIKPQIPVEPTTRMITMRSHQKGGQTPAAWNFASNNLLVDADGITTDVFYFSRALDEAEVRYIAFNGIDSAVGTEVSGVIGGFIHGQDTGSGLMGGFIPGIDTGSGVMGGFIPGGLLASGIAGGFVSGVVFGDGTIGGFVRGLDTGSGVYAGFIHGVDIGSGMIAGYIQGQDVGSGHFGGLLIGSEASSGLLGGFLSGADQGSGLFGGFVLGGLQGNFEFDAGFSVEVLSSEDFDVQLEIAKTVASDFDAKLVIFQDEVPPLVEITIPEVTVSGLVPPFNQYFIAKASGQQGKTIASTKWTFGDFSPTVSVAESGAGCHPVQHLYAASGFYIAKFEAIDSDGLHASDTVIINAASGIDPVISSLSGVPRSGDQALIVDFTTTVDILPPGVSITASLLNFDDGQTTSALNPTHTFSQPGTYRPIWCVRDSRGITWCDSLEEGNDFLQNGGTS